MGYLCHSKLEYEKLNTKQYQSTGCEAEEYLRRYLYKQGKQHDINMHH